MSLSTPVALFIFNRPDLTRVAFEAIAEVRPRKLLVIADGPRSPEEAEKCRQARAICERVDWPCEVVTNFSEANMGCKNRVASGLDWVFSQNDEAIIIEDDCLPDQSFFSFSEQLLKHYRDDERVMHINGGNFLSDRISLEHSYYFSRYTFGGYGWASWSRAWKHFDKHMKSWPEFKRSGMLAQLFETSDEQDFWRSILDRTYEGEIDTWDFQWFYAVWTQGGLSIVPRVNLVSNLGFRDDATHTLTETGLANVPAARIDAIAHPPFIVRNRQADALTHEFYFGQRQPQSEASKSTRVRGYLSAVKGRLSRSRLRRSLRSLDTRFGVREWLNQDNGVDNEPAHRPTDPFAVSELPHPRPNTVLDIGGSHGQFAREALRAFPGVNIYSFEPIPECYQELLALSESAPTVHPLNLALSDRDGEQDLWLSSFRDSSSLHEMLPAHLAAWPHTAIETKISVKVVRLDAVTPDLDLERPVFAKIDVQGHELAVIRGGRSTLSLCERVMLECNFAQLYEGQPSFTQLYDELQSLGFLFDGFISPLRHPQTLELLSADAVFYKPVEIAELDGL